MNAQAQITTQPQHSVGLLNLESFELSQRIAKMLSSSTLVPEQYRATIQKKAGKDDYGNQLYIETPNPNGLSNCVIALNMSNRMGADPLMVMQNLYLIEGRPAWSSQFIMAAINSCGRFSALRFELEDLGEKEVEYQVTEWQNRQKKVVTKTVKIHDMACTAWVIEKGSLNTDGSAVILKSSRITIEMAVKEGWYGKNGSKWQTMPEQMLRYRSASFFGRVYAPELLMGLRSVEEEQDKIIDVTPQGEVTTSVEKLDIAPVKKQILKAKTIDELNNLANEVQKFEGKDRTDLDKILDAQYKKLAESNVIEPEAVEVKQNDAVKKVTSDELRKAFSSEINKADSLERLNTLKTEYSNSNDLTNEHKAYLEEAYLQRKEILSQGDIFDTQPQTDYAQVIIERIENCKTQDEINSIFTSLETDQDAANLTQEQRDLIGSAADRREAEIQG